MPKISIVLPTYNGEQYIEKSIQSVIEQTFRDWELIVVDDCSTDSTHEIAKKYERIDKRIRVIQNQVNSKTPTALNNGFRMATGEYFTWTSDDNIYYEDALEVMVNYMDKYPNCGLAYCDMEYIDEQGTVIGSEKTDPDYLYYNCPVGGCFIYKGEIPTRIGGYDPEMFLIEDYEYWLRISKYYEVHRIPLTKYKFRKHMGSQTYQRAREVNDKLYLLRERQLDFLLSRVNNEYKKKLFIDMYLQKGEEKIIQKFWGDSLPSEMYSLVYREKVLDESKKYIVFGSGDYGIRTINLIGKEKIECFVDNNPKRVGMMVEEIPIKSFDFLKENVENYNMVISVSTNVIEQVVKQFKEHDIQNYLTYIELLNNNHL